MSILDECVIKMNEVLEVLRVQGARIGLKINVKKIAYGLLWLPGLLTVFQTVGCTKSVVQSHFLGPS